MAKVTAKLQVTIPRALARQYGIEPGQELDWQAAGEVIRVVPTGRMPRARDVRGRLALFDAATRRQRGRERAKQAPVRRVSERGWRREDLYERGTAR